VQRDGGAREIDGDPPVPAWGARPWHLVQDSVAAFEAHVVDVLRGEAEPQPLGRHNLDTLALALAAYRSAARDEVVDMDRFVAGGCVR
jgi:D-apiose dehydrogenase